MSYIKTPSLFFGPGYSLASSEIKLKTATHAGTLVGTTVGSNATADILEFASAHNLKVNDIVKFTQVTTLPTGLAAATAYYVKTVPSTTTITLSLTKGGTTLGITASSGTTDNTCNVIGPLMEITDTEADAGSGGDYRKILYGLMEMISQRWAGTPVADRPGKVTITRTPAPNATTGEITYFYSVSITTTPTGIEVSDEA